MCGILRVVEAVMPDKGTVVDVRAAITNERILDDVSKERDRQIDKWGRAASPFLCVDGGVGRRGW
jgi:hypothetical protein